MGDAEAGKDLRTAGEEGEGDLMRLEEKKRLKKNSRKAERKLGKAAGGRKGKKKVCWRGN